MTDAPATGLTPHITIRDARAAEAIDFYARAFGATEKLRVPADDKKRLMHAHLTINGASLMLHDDFPEYRGGAAEPAPVGMVLHLQVDDADTWFDRATGAGAAIITPPPRATRILRSSSSTSISVRPVSASSSASSRTSLISTFMPELRPAEPLVSAITCLLS